MAGHDYCGRKADVPKYLMLQQVAGPAGAGGFATVPDFRPCFHYAEPGAEVVEQSGVVRAVLEWLEEETSGMELRVTAENFTRTSLEEVGIDYDAIIAETRNPSWYLFKPL